MMSSLIPRLRRYRTSSTGRALWFALALLLLTLQTALPAHLESHHLGQAPDIHCQYCVLGDHLFGPTTSMLPLASTEYRPGLPLVVFAAAAPAPYPRTVYSRGPPSAIDA